MSTSPEEQSLRFQMLQLASSGKDILKEPAAVGSMFPNACNKELANGAIHCEYGLPEAQLALSQLYCARQLKQLSSHWESRAYYGGLWTARNAVNCAG